MIIEQTIHPNDTIMSARINKELQKCFNTIM